MTISSFFNKLLGKTNQSANTEQAPAPFNSSIIVMSPLKGTVLPLSEVPDPVFAEKIMGDGVAINPIDNHIYAPFNGKISALFDSSKHAVGLVSQDGIELLIHVGVDTVNLTNNEFCYHVKMNQHIKQGDLLMSFDSDAIKAAGYSLITPIIITNTDNYAQIDVSADMNSVITQQDKLLTLNK